MSASSDSEPRTSHGTPTRLDQFLRFPPLSLVLLFGPAWIAVTLANALADSLYGLVSALIGPLLDRLNALPAPLAATLGGDYGIVAMLPFLLLYALPTILAFTVLIETYKTTGLAERLSANLHGWLRPFGLGGHDLVRVVMGFGCNVPAIAATRSCTTCSGCVRLRDLLRLRLLLSATRHTRRIRGVWSHLARPSLPRTARSHDPNLPALDHACSATQSSQR